MICRFLSKLFLFLEFKYLYCLGKTFGITCIVCYLRNPNPKITVKLLKAFGAVIGEKTIFKRSIFFDNVFEDQNSCGDFRYLQVGKNCYIGDAVYFDLSNKVIIKNNAVIAGKVSFVTHSDCNRSEYLNKKFPRVSKKIKVEDGAWLGFGSTILCGVTIGQKSVVAACSFVKNDVEEYFLAGGIPARKIKII